MPYALTLYLDEARFATLQQMAGARGLAPQLLAEGWLAQRLDDVARDLNDEPAPVADLALARHFGRIASGDPHSSDNERIDADLAREYARGCENG